MKGKKITLTTTLNIVCALAIWRGKIGEVLTDQIRERGDKGNKE